MRHHTTVRLTRTSVARLREIAEAKRCSVSDLVNDAVSIYLNNEDAIGHRLDLLRSALDDNHVQTLKAMTTLAKEQTIQIGELIALLADDIKPSPSMHRAPSSSADVQARIQEIERRKQRGET